MIRALLASLLLVLAGAALAQGARDWRTAVQATPAGGMLVGNPQAPVTLTEWVSYSCPHCGHFAAESAPVLKDQLVRGGRVRLDVRTLPRNRYDLAAGLLARCAGPARFLGHHEALFAQQARLLAAAEAFEGKADAYAGAATTPAQLQRLAKASGMLALVQARGLAPAQASACLADQAATDRLVGLARAAQGRISGTPSFEIGGNLIVGSSWAELEPPLRSALAQ